MLETILMGASLIVLGYAFYISSRMFWVHRSQSGIFRLMYFLVVVFVITTHFFFSIILIIFMTSSPLLSQVMNLFNSILAIFWLAGAGLVAAIMKYHLNVVSSGSEKEIRKVSVTRVTKRKDPRSSRLLGEIASLKKELENAKKLNRLAVGREFRMIELKNRLKEYESGK